MSENIHSYYICCTYHDLKKINGEMNLNIPQEIWAIVSTLEEAKLYVMMIRKRKFDTLNGAWDIYLEDDERPGKTWNYRKIVKHYPPKRNYDFYGNQINDLKVAIVQ